MVRLKIGDILKLKTSSGNIYLQYVYKDDQLGELVKVFKGLHPNEIADFCKLVSEPEEFLVFFPLSAAYKKKIVELSGHEVIKSFKKPEYMRAEHYIAGEFMGWDIVNTSTWERNFKKTLSNEEKELSPWGVWNDTLLIERMQSGWNLKNW